MSLRPPPPARVSIGTAHTSAGAVEVFASTEWARYFEMLNSLAVQTATGPGGLADVNADDTWHDDLSAREALQAVDELRNEVAALRSENNAIRQVLDELSSAIDAIRRTDDLRSRIEQLENVTESRTENQLRSRIEQLEDRLQ